MRLWALLLVLLLCAGCANITLAVVDRFEGDQAVILVSGEQHALVVDRSQLPPGTTEGTWLRVYVKDDRILAATIYSGRR